MKLQKDIPPYDFITDLDKGGLVGRLLAFACKKIRKIEDVEDVVGQVILELIEDVKSGRKIQCRSYVFIALKNHISDYFEQDGRENGKLESLTREPADTSINSESDSRSSRELPKSALCVLTSAQREVLDLVKKGRSQIEISEELCISPRAVSDRYNKSLTSINLHLICIPLFEKLKHNFDENVLKKFCRANQLSSRTVRRHFNIWLECRGL